MDRRKRLYPLLRRMQTRLVSLSANGLTFEGDRLRLGYRRREARSSGLRLESGTVFSGFLGRI